MDNDLRILITGTLNIGKSIGEINTAISGIEKKIKKLKLNVEINDKTTQTLQNFSKAMEKMKVIQQDLQRSYKEEETVIKKLDGSTEKVTRQYLKSGEIIEKTKKIINEKTKATEKEADATSRLANDLGNLGKVQQRVTNQDGKGNATGFTDKYRNGYVDTIVNTDKDGKVTSMRIVENLKQEDDATRKLIQSKNELRHKHQELIQMGQLSSQQSLKMQKIIETSNSPEKIKQAANEYDKLLGISKEQLKVHQARQNVAKKKEIEIQKEKEHNKILQQQLDLYKKKQALQVQDLKHRYAGAIDNKALDAHMNKVNAIGISKDTPHLMRETALGLKQIEVNAKAAGGAIGKAHSHSISLGEAFKTAMVKFP